MLSRRYIYINTKIQYKGIYVTLGEEAIANLSKYQFIYTIAILL